MADLTDVPKAPFPQLPAGTPPSRKRIRLPLLVAFVAAVAAGGFVLGTHESHTRSAVPTTTNTTSPSSVTIPPSSTLPLSITPPATTPPAATTPSITTPVPAPTAPATVSHPAPTTTTTTTPAPIWTWAIGPTNGLHAPVAAEADASEAARQISYITSPPPPVVEADSIRPFCSTTAGDVALAQQEPPVPIAADAQAVAAAMTTISQGATQCLMDTNPQAPNIASLPAAAATLTAGANAFHAILVVIEAQIEAANPANPS